MDTILNSYISNPLYIEFIFCLDPYTKIAHHQSSTAEGSEFWNTVVSKTKICVLDENPSDCVLANYLGRDVENSYRVGCN